MWANSYEPTWWRVYERHMGRVQTAGAVRGEDKEQGQEGGAKARKDLAHADCQPCPLPSGVGGVGVGRNGWLRCSLLGTGRCGRLADSPGVTTVLFRREHYQQQGGLCGSRF